MTNHEEFYNKDTGLYANQKQTTLIRVTPEQFKKAKGLAAKTLTFSAFKIFDYALLDQNGFQRIWSPKQLEDWCGMARSAYYKGMTELQKYGVIKKDENGNLIFDAGAFLPEEEGAVGSQDENGNFIF